MVLQGYPGGAGHRLPVRWKRAAHEADHERSRWKRAAHEADHERSRW